MSLINIKNLTFGFAGHDNIFENVSLQLNTDWKLGLVGRNGKGKTTLLKLLEGKYEFTGKIESDINYEYFPYEIKNNNITVLKLASEFAPKIEKWQIEREFSILKLNNDILDRKYNNISNGEKTKILLVLLFLKDNSFLLIDEPTNHLDYIGREQLSEYLKLKKGFILVSHDRSFLDNCTDHTLSINKSDIILHKGNFTCFFENKVKQNESELEKNEKLKAEINRLKISSNRLSGWSEKCESKKFQGKQACGLKPDKGYLGHKAAKLMKSAKVAETRYLNSIEEKSKLLKNIDTADSLTLDSLKYHSERLITINNLVINYNNKQINNPLTFEILQGDRIAVTGKNGSGKTSIIKAISGQIDNFYGEIIKSQNLIISYVPQDTSNLSGSLEEFCYNYKLDKTKLFIYLIKLGFERMHLENSIENFSEGQKKKLLIAKSLCEKANIYVWDEPLNYVDIITRKQLSDLIKLSKPTMIFSEHDKYFCEEIATKHIEI
jgi:lincosamide and streptogramin A transport system ATP-binding/permease protein